MTEREKIQQLIRESGRGKETKIGPFYLYRARSLWWFRLFGWGLHWKRISVRGLLFSERNGYEGWRWGDWYFKFLRPPWC